MNELVGSTNQCNTILGKVELEGDRDGRLGMPGLVCGPESVPVASKKTWIVVERDQSGS